MCELSHEVICIIGPTASGKSELAQRVALEMNGEVVSADSMQVYRGMDIGTGKVMPNERRVTHYGIDLVEPGEPYSAALFQNYARECFYDIESRGKRSILVGGTGLYVRATIDDYRFPKGDQTTNSVRSFYTSYAQEHGQLALWELLNEKDPESAALIHPNNTRRVIRAFELLEDNTNYAVQKERLANLAQRVPACFIGLRVDPDLLRQRIDKRIDNMVESGLVDEVKGLLDKGLRVGITSSQAIGYKEIADALDDRITLDDAIEKIKIATHRYAKRQRSWFSKDKRIHWFDADESLDSTADRVLEYIKSKSK